MFQVGTFRDAELERLSMAGTSSTDEALSKVFQKHLHVSSGEALSTDWIRAAMSVWELVQTNGLSCELLLASEECFGKKGPFASIFKLEAVVRRCGSNVMKAHWVLCKMVDSTLNPRPGSVEMTISNLIGKGKGMRGHGLIDTWAFKFDLLQYVLHDCPRFCKLSIEDQSSLRDSLKDFEAYRRRRGGKVFAPASILSNIPAPPAIPASWLGALSESARKYFMALEGTIYADRRENEIMSCVQLSSSLADVFAEGGFLGEAMAEIDELLATCSKQSPDIQSGLVQVQPSASCEVVVPNNLPSIIQVDIPENCNQEMLDAINAAQEESAETVAMTSVFIDGSRSIKDIVAALDGHGFSNRLGSPDGNVVIIYDVKAGS